MENDICMRWWWQGRKSCVRVMLCVVRNWVRQQTDDVCCVQCCDVRCHEKREIKFLIARDMVSQIWIQVGCGLHAPILKSTAEKQRNWYMRTSNKSSQHNWQLFNIYKPRHNNVVEVIEYAWSRHAIPDVYVFQRICHLCGMISIEMPYCGKCGSQCKPSPKHSFGKFNGKHSIGEF